MAFIIAGCPTPTILIPEPSHIYVTPINDYWYNYALMTSKLSTNAVLIIDTYIDEHLIRNVSITTTRRFEVQCTAEASPQSKAKAWIRRPNIPQLQANQIEAPPTPPGSHQAKAEAPPNTATS